MNMQQGLARDGRSLLVFAIIMVITKKKKTKG
jgi:hypothetical protein